MLCSLFYVKNNYCSLSEVQNVYICDFLFEKLKPFWKNYIFPLFMVYLTQMYTYRHELHYTFVPDVQGNDAYLFKVLCFLLPTVGFYMIHKLHY